MSDPARTAGPDAGTASAADPVATSASEYRPVGPALPVALAGADRYVLGEEIARGAMGVVHRATDAAFAREVAVKILLDKYAPDSAAACRFHDEARITGQLQHPGIPPVFDLGAFADGRPFLAMKLIKGDTLESLLAARTDSAVDRGRLVAVFEQVCHAVAYAHAHDVIHRDLKPANVMVGAFGEVQVMDWGLAKVMSDRPDTEADADTARGTAVVSIRDSDGSFTQAGSVLGTPAFMPPEQAVGAVHKVGPHSDVFGLGAVLAVILTGKPPFPGSSGDTARLRAATGDVAECFRRLDGCGADPELVALCKRCLSPGPEDRPANAGAVAKAVAALRAAADERARQAELDRVRAEGEKTAAELKSAEQRKRRKVQAALGLAFMALVALGCSFAWNQDRHATIRRLEAENRDRAEQERRDHNADAIDVVLGQVEAALRDGDTVRAGIALEQADRRTAEGAGEHQTARLIRTRADFHMLRDIDRIDSLRWSNEMRIPGGPQAADEWPGAFARFGIVPGRTPTADCVRTINESTIPERLLSALDRWHRVSGLMELREILRAIDPDPYRMNVRAALATGTAARGQARELASRPEALDQPAWFATFIGEWAPVGPARRREILLAVVDRRPDDFRALMALALGSERADDQAASAVEREHWLRAALAVRPDQAAVWLRLADALFGQGRVDEELVCSSCRRPWTFCTAAAVVSGKTRPKAKTAYTAGDAP
jgi:tRNA A-37 threonylcarbamoyl transferase component Bud32